MGVTIWNEIFVWAWRLAVIVFLWLIWHEVKWGVFQLQDLNHRNPQVMGVIAVQLGKILEAIKTEKAR